MQQFTFTKSKVLGLKLISPFYVQDNRGYFLKSYEKEIFAQNEVFHDIFEDFESYSQKGVIRGLHFQTDSPQSKLVRAISGKIFDVAVDLRFDSKTFGKWEGFFLSDRNRISLLIPRGFAHGFLVLSESALVTYQCAGQYSKATDCGIRWNDKDLAIPWPIDDFSKVTVSERDALLPTFSEYIQRFRFRVTES